MRRTNIADRLKHLSEVGTVVTCREMELLAGDHEPPVVTGEGEITVLTPASFGYRLRGTPQDVGHALRSLRRIDADPYDGSLRERLVVTTADGLKLLCGWTIPKVHAAEAGSPWTFTGEVDALSFRQDGEFEAGTEVAYLLPRQHRARISLRRFFPERTGDELPEVRLAVLGSDVVLALDDEADMLLARAPATGALRPTYAENWLGEPLRILFGQRIHPRFVARQASSWMMGWIRPSSEWSNDSGACALWRGEREFIDRDGFWDSYGRLLAYVAAARGRDGSPNFEENEVTRIYGELIQAAHVSRWIWALTFSSAVEAMAGLLGLAGQPRTDMDAAALAALRGEVDGFKSFLDGWRGDARLKETAKGAASRQLTTSAARGLRQLKLEGRITAEQLSAWERVRNRVMHGSLLSPYSSAEEDKLLVDLSELLHALTRRLLMGVDPASGLPGND